MEQWSNLASLPFCQCVLIVTIKVLKSVVGKSGQQSPHAWRYTSGNNDPTDTPRVPNTREEHRLPIPVLPNFPNFLSISTPNDAWVSHERTRQTSAK